MRIFFVVGAALVLAGCLKPPAMLDASKICDSSYIHESDPAKYMEGYRRERDCAQKVDAENQRRRARWNAAMMDDYVPQQSRSFAPPPSSYVLHTQPPGPPAPMPTPDSSTMMSTPRSSAQPMGCIGVVPTPGSPMPCP